MLNAWGGILRPRLHALLSKETLGHGVDVRLGLTVDALEECNGAVSVRFSDGSNALYDLVVSADGIMSRVRSLIFPNAPLPQFTGQRCWRVVFRRSPEVDASHLFVDPDKKIGLNPVSEDEKCMFLLESAPGNLWYEEAGWHEALASRLRAFGGLPSVLADQIDDRSLVNYRPLEALLLPTPWYGGGVVLINDAVHATTLHAGFGTGLAIGDTLVLSMMLA